MKRFFISSVILGAAFLLPVAIYYDGCVHEHMPPGYVMVRLSNGTYSGMSEADHYVLESAISRTQFGARLDSWYFYLADVCRHDPRVSYTIITNR